MAMRQVSAGDWYKAKRFIKIKMNSELCLRSYDLRVDRYNVLLLI